MQETAQDRELFDMLTSLLRKIHIMYQAYKWSRTARRAINNRDYSMAEMAIKKFDELNKMI